MIFSNLVEAESEGNSPQSGVMIENSEIHKKKIGRERPQARYLASLKGVHPSAESVTNSSVSYHELLATWIRDKNTAHCSHYATCRTTRILEYRFKFRKFRIFFLSLDSRPCTVDALQITPFPRATQNRRLPKMC